MKKKKRTREEVGSSSTWSFLCPPRADPCHLGPEGPSLEQESWGFGGLLATGSIGVDGMGCLLMNILAIIFFNNGRSVGHLLKGIIFKKA